MTRLMVRRGAFLVFGQDHRLALCTHVNLVFCALKVFHVDEALVAARGEQCGFVYKVRNVRAGKAGATTCDNLRLDVSRDRHLAHMHLQNLLATTNVWQRHNHLAVETAWTHQCRVKHVRTVGRGDHDHALRAFEAIHFNEHLV